MVSELLVSRHGINLSAPPPPPPTSPHPSTFSSSPNLSPGSIILLNHLISTKLTHTSYIAWKSQIEPLLYGYGLHRFLTSPPPAPTITIDGHQVENLDHRPDQFLLGWLRSSLSENLLGQVVFCLTSSALWAHLQQTFSATSRARLAKLRRNLQTTVKGGSNCSDYFQRIRSIADELAFIGHPVPDDNLILYILDNLGADFNAFVIAATTKDHLSLLELQAFLLSHEKLLETQNGSASSPCAFVVSTNHLKESDIFF